MMGKKNTEVKINTLLGMGTELNGDFSAQGSVRIDGKIDGNVTVTGSLILGAGGTISGNVTANAVLIGGEVLGNIQATEKAELTSTGRVLGDIATRVIVIDENAVFQGRCNMNQEIPDRKVRNAANKAARAGKKSAKAAIEEALKEVAEEENRQAQTEGQIESSVTEQTTVES